MPLPPLDKIDAAEAWQPWQPSPADSWGRKWAAHLYRRAAFGASRNELLEADRLGPDGTLDLLLKARPEAANVEKSLADVGRIAASRDERGEQLRGWWLYCMLQSSHPLREKMTLFWHNHFATSLVKVQDTLLMYRQNWLLRTRALGRFGPMLQAISRDGAMLIWLDANSNVKGKPNENYARELMELFSLGVGHYTEKDIREAARAFTGWHTAGEGFRFNSREHDDGAKTVLGQSGAWDGGDIVRIVLEQPAAARFLVRKLYHYLISEQAEPPDSLLEPLCTSFRKSDYDITALLKTMLSSRHFYSDYAFRQRVKSPVEFVLGAVNAVYGRVPEDNPDYRPLPQQVLVPWLDAMGQSLFAPPNVKGWPGAITWLNTSTVLERNNFATALAMGTLWTHATAGKSFGKPMSPAEFAEEPPPPKAFDCARLLAEEKADKPEKALHALLNLYLPGGVRPEAEKKLLAFAAEGKPTGPGLERRARETVHAILTMPENQMA
ncbi:MAG TPA: DUF1800 domain-containing protein [Gemmataceae bacterium]|jgi:uncharacterized protein (DUF1800 family)|nr:DUF1800 domain-containing protein [Gemmataceae bacterium]